MLPPKDLNARKLATVTLARRATLFRIHRHPDPVHYDRGAGSRWNAPSGAFGVLYAAFDFEGAFIETLLRNPTDNVVSERDLASRLVTQLEVTARLDLIDLDGANLRKNGLSLSTVYADYAITQAWAAAFHDHSSHADGLRYRSRFNPQLMCVAVFDRAASKIRARMATREPLTANPKLLAAILDKYDVALVA